MDVDTASADGEEDGETASPNVGSEPEQVEVMERYDSMDVMVQTDYKSGPKTSTITWTIDKPGAAVQRATWNPRTESDGSKTLLTVGPKLYRFYQIPDSILDLKQVRMLRIRGHFAGADSFPLQLKHLDEPLLQEDGAVTAAAWRADGQAACCAIDDMRKLPGGAEVPQQILLEHRQDGNSTALQLGPPTLEPAGAVMGIHYSPDGKYILGVRTNLKRSLIQIWKCHSVEEKHAEVNGASEMAGSISSMTLPGQPLAWKFFDGELFDATWTADDTFVVCGERGLAALYQVDQGHNAATVLPAGSVAMRGLISRNANILSDTATWDKVQFDQRHRLAVFASSSEKRLVITPLIYDTELGSAIQNHLELPAGKNMEALMVQPWRKPTDDHDLSAERDKASLLATAFDDGSFTIHRLNNSASKNSSHWRKVVELWLADAPATALSWSPDGHHLAVSGADVVQIWHAASFTRRNGAIHLPRPAVTWRPEATKNGTPDAQQGDEVTQPSLSWSSDGESLVFAADRQVCSGFERSMFVRQITNPDARLRSSASIHH
jgi:WD40 repeat protein